MVRMKISIEAVAISSSQDTCVALQALAAYSEATAGRDQINLRVEVCIGDKYKKTLLINQRNALVQQQLDVGEMNCTA